MIFLRTDCCWNNFQITKAKCLTCTRMKNMLNAVFLRSVRGAVIVKFLYEFVDLIEKQDRLILWDMNWSKIDKNNIRIWFHHEGTLPTASKLLSKPLQLSELDSFFTGLLKFYTSKPGATILVKYADHLQCYEYLSRSLCSSQIITLRKFTLNFI